MERSNDTARTSRGSETPRRIVLGITGATGAIFGIRLLERLRDCGVASHLVLSRWARATIELETPYSVAQVEALASVVHAPGDQAAAIASGSFRTAGMIVAPCSMKSLAGIRAGYANELIERAADVTLKEGRKLVLVVRESPLSAIHLENMLALARIGVAILPPVPGFYMKPAGLDDVVDHVVARALDQLGIEVAGAARWDGTAAARSLAPTLVAELPPALCELLGDEPPRGAETACELATVDAAGYPSIALLGRGEIVARDASRLAIALWPASRTVARLRESRTATLVAIAGEAQITARLRVRPVDASVLADRACFLAEVVSCESAAAPYARLTGGVAFVPHDPVAYAADCARRRAALAAIALEPA